MSAINRTRDNKRKLITKQEEPKEPECLILTIDSTTGPKEQLLLPIGQFEHRILYIEGSEQDLQEYQATMQAQGQHSVGSSVTKGCLGA